MQKKKSHDKYKNFNKIHVLRSNKQNTKLFRTKSRLIKYQGGSFSLKSIKFAVINCTCKTVLLLYYSSGKQTKVII